MTLVTTKYITSKAEPINEIQISDTDPGTDTEDNESTGWRSLPETVTPSEDSDTCDTDEKE